MVLTETCRSLFMVLRLYVRTRSLQSSHHHPVRRANRIRKILCGKRAVMFKPVAMACANFASTLLATSL